jgi:putative glutamine amidotransferase
MAVNSAHHQAAKEVGADVVVNAVTSDGVIEGIESTVHEFCLGVQWHPEFTIDPGDEKIFQALVAAAQR